MSLIFSTVVVDDLDDSLARFAIIANGLSKAGVMATEVGKEKGKQELLCAILIVSSCSLRDLAQGVNAMVIFVNLDPWRTLPTYCLMDNLYTSNPWQRYVVSSLMDTAYRMSESVSSNVSVQAPECPMIEENEVTRTKKYVELSATKKIQADCDLKATNIILQGLPSDVYSLVNHHKVAKDLWERVQLLMQVNTKFLNSLPPEWSKFVTGVKLVRDLHTTNFDLLNAYLEQHKLHSPQYGLIHPTQHYSTTYPSTPLAITYPSALYPNAYSFIVHQDACTQPQFIPQIEYTVSTFNQQTHLANFPQIDSSLAVPMFKHGDDPINAINKMMSFLSIVITSRFPSTNNQLRNSSNPRQQATIHDGRVTVQLVQGRQNSFASGTSGTRANISGT
ncbi:hypothetical protein Tco_1176048 [Tanacetum coccineum]